MNTNALLLRRALLGDGIFESVCALIFILGANALAGWTGWDIPGMFIAAGVALGGVALLLYWMATQVHINLSLAGLIMILNAVCALAGVVALIAFWSSLTDGARWLIAVLAVFVGIFGVLEYAGLRSVPPAK